MEKEDALPKSVKEQLHRTQPQKEQTRRVYFLILLIILSVSFLSLAIFVKLNPIITYDLTVTLAIQTFNIPIWDYFMKFLTWIGNGWQEIIIPLSITFAIWIFRQKTEALFLLISTIGVVFISELFKFIIARPRPDGTLVIQIGEFVRNDSFPSGHVLFFIGFFGFLLFLVYSRLKRSILRTVLIFILSIFIACIGISRIYLGAHWFSDVLGSYLIGTVWLIIIVHFYNRLKLRGK